MVNQEWNWLQTEEKPGQSPGSAKPPCEASYRCQEPEISSDSLDDEVVMWVGVKILLVSDATTCKGRLGKLVEVTLRLRLSRWIASAVEGLKVKTNE